MCPVHSSHGGRACIVFCLLGLLRYLSVNANRIADLDLFVAMLQGSCPRLQWLSMVNNKACPYLKVGKIAEYEYTEYRLRVVAKLKTLKVLDTSHIGAEERAKAQSMQVWQRPEAATSSIPFVGIAGDYLPLGAPPSPPHRGTAGRGRVPHACVCLAEREEGTHGA